MPKTTPSRRLKSLYIARFLLEAEGVLLILGGIFAIVLTVADVGAMRAHYGTRVLFRFVAGGPLMLLCGTGFLLPQIWAKLGASLLLAGIGTWMFRTDTYRWDNLGIYCLFFIPLVSALWLRKGYHDLQIRRLSDAH